MTITARIIVHGAFVSKEQLVIVINREVKVCVTEYFKLFIFFFFEIDLSVFASI
jgi:hypothetical protein